MSIVIFSFLLAGILLSALWFHDVWYQPEGRTEKKQWSSALDRGSGNRLNRQRIVQQHHQPWGRKLSGHPRFHQER